MNWSKIKNIMIVILTLINLFLIFDIWLTDYLSTALPAGTGESFIRVLENQGIEYEGYLVPKYYEERKKVDAQPYDASELVETFLGEAAVYKSAGTRVVAQADTNQLTVSGVDIEYNAPGEACAKNGDDIIKALNKAGIGNSGAKFVKNEGMVRVFVDDCLVEGVYLDVTLSENGDIIHLKGAWPKILVKSDTEKVSIIASVNKICETIPKGSCIDRVEKIYITRRTEKGCSVSPGWKLFCENKSYTID